MNQIVALFLVILNFSFICATPQYEIMAGNNALIQSGQIDCDTLTCPSNSFACSVTKKSTNNYQNVVITRNCLTENGSILLQQVITAVSPDPGYPVNNYSYVDRNGNADNCNDCNSSAQIENTSANEKAAQEVGQVVDAATANLGPEIDSIVNNALNQAGIGALENL